MFIRNRLSQPEQTTRLRMPDLTIPSELINRINRGDARAFETLYNAYYVYLCAVAVKYVYDPAVAQEITNDVFLNAWHLREQLVYPVNAYLRQAVQNRSLNYLRSLRMQEVPLTEAEEKLLRFREMQTGSDEHPLGRLENKELHQLVAEAVSRLPERCRQVFTQKFYYGKTSEEIARECGLNASTVRVQLKIALTKLKEELRDVYPVWLLFF